MRDNAWDEVRREVSAGDLIKNWTAAKGYYGEDFVVEDVGAYSLEVRLGSDSIRTVTARDFDVVSPHWDDYCAGHFPRGDFTPLTMNSKYVISILHILKEKRAKSSPL
jgi:hypothetical protein